MSYQVTVESVREQIVAAARQRTTFRKISREIGSLLDRPWGLIRGQPNLRANGDNVAIYWDESGEGSIEVGVQVERRFEDTADVVCSSTPAGTSATTAHFGPYQELRAAHEAVREWCAANQREFVLPFWEVYGDWNDDTAKLRTDVFYLLR
jgi:effector-binding domain-containing protein